MTEQLELQEQKEVKPKNELTAFFDHPNVKGKLQSLLGSKSVGFISSLLQAVNGNDQLKNANKISIYHAAVTAAVLDLPINPNLGFAWIVPYKGQAQFQLGYKGFVQLAQRTGQYKSINVIPVYQNQFTSWNELTEEIQGDFAKLGEGKVVGYCAYFKLINGFEKYSFWTAEKVERHAKKYSKNFNSDKSTWKSEFEAMALKTVLKNMLSKWGILSIEMQEAIKVDQGIIKDEEGQEVEYPDSTWTEAEEVEPGDKAEKAADHTLTAMKEITTKAKHK